MSNSALHKIYNPYSRSLSFEYLAIMRDKRNEIVEKIVNDLKKRAEKQRKRAKEINKKELVLLIKLWRFENENKKRYF